MVLASPLQISFRVETTTRHVSEPTIAANPKEIDVNDYPLSAKVGGPGGFEPLAENFEGSGNRIKP